MSWSVYCQASNIAIRSGDECVIIPLTANRGRFGYSKYIPATLPIEGIYNDYGGLENIVKNENTKLIEKVTGVSVEDFVTYLVDGVYTYGRDEAKEVSERILDKEYMSKLRFCWVRKDVYEALSKTLVLKGEFNIGSRFVLEELGFEKVGKIEGRYSQVWKKGDDTLYSDGTWLLEGGYNIKSLSEFVTIDEKHLTLDNNSFYSFYDKMTDAEFLEMIPLDIYRYDEDDLENNTFNSNYIRNISKFKLEFSNSMELRSNLGSMSKFLEPFTLYSTPQSGDNKNHKKLMKIFLNIIKLC